MLCHLVFVICVIVSLNYHSASLPSTHVYNGVLAACSNGFISKCIWLFLVTGDNPSMADYLMWPWIERLYMLADLSKFQVLLAWCAAMSDVPAVQECSYPVEWHKKFIEMHKAGNPDSQLYGIKEKA